MIVIRAKRSYIGGVQYQIHAARKTSKEISKGIFTENVRKQHGYFLEGTFSPHITPYICGVYFVD